MNPAVLNVFKKCPYNEKCYRRNPIHFNEMSHPHLEKLVINQLDSEIRIPNVLDFDCPDRALLFDQLKILQMILKKRSDSTGSSSTNILKDKSDFSDKNGIRDLKDKVERHKEITQQRRVNKLMEMDAKAEVLSEPSTSNNEIIEVFKMREELANTKLMMEEIEKSENSRKRKLESESNSKHSQEVSSQRAKSPECSSSSGGTSLIEAFTSCDSEKSREKFRNKAIEMMKLHGYKLSLVEPGNFDLKFALSAPYHLFFTRIQDSKPTYNQQLSITFPEILDSSLGEIECSLHLNFMVDVGWLCLQYLLAGQRTDMLILYGDRTDTENLPGNVKMLFVQMPTKFGCHHTKVMILKYKDDGIRVIVSTANLYADDWENRTQGLWISPHLPALPETANTGDGESPTGFRKDLERYFSKYKQPALTKWVCMIRKADFSSVNVFFVASVPGNHETPEYDFWGHRKLASVLSKHATLPPDAPQWPIVAQSSSIGSLGPHFDSWLSKDIVNSMSKETTKGLKSSPNFQFIYPTVNNYKQSSDCRVGSSCLPYSLQTHLKQKWIKSYLYQWKATDTHRNKAMPHIKSYTRLSPDLKRIPWFVLTSANLSKAAWGVTRKNHSILSYEAGVVFIPKFINGLTTFPIQEEEAGTPVFPIPYDIPLTRYEPHDEPFISELFFNDT